MSLLRNGRVATRLPAQDLERARAFYAEKLGLGNLLGIGQSLAG
jgi:hypothetical protein